METKAQDKVAHHIIEDIVISAVYEQLARAYARTNIVDEFTSLSESIISIVAEQTPDNWLHSHNFPALIKDINEDRDLFSFLTGVDNMIHSRLAYRGVSMDDAIASCYSGLATISTNTHQRNANFVVQDLLDKWPDSKSVIDRLKANPFLLTLFLINANVQLLDLFRFTREELVEGMKNVKKWATAEQGQG